MIYSPVLAKALMRRRLDAAFIRPEEHMGELGLYARAYRPANFRVSRVTIVWRHRVAVAPEEIVNETFYLPSKARPRGASLGYRVFQPCWSRSQARIRCAQYRPHAISMIFVEPARGYAVTGLHKTLSARSITTRPVKGEVPTLDLVIAYHKSNNSPIPRCFSPFPIQQIGQGAFLGMFEERLFRDFDTSS